MRRRGIDVLTAFEDGRAEASDEELLARATEVGRIVFTQDDDFLAIADDWQRNGRDFAGLVYAHQLQVTVGQIVTDLQLILEVATLDENAHGLVSSLVKKDSPLQCPDDPAANLPKILDSPSYRVAYKDVDFLDRPELRPARMELELIKPELYFQRTQYPLDDRGFRQHADRRAGRVARRQLEQAEQALAEAPDDPRTAAGGGPGRAAPGSGATTTRRPGSSPGWFPSSGRTAGRTTT